MIKIQIIGEINSGKSTIAQEIYRNLKQIRRRVALIEKDPSIKIETIQINKDHGTS